MDIEIENEILMHYGVKRRSGRYPWGSGDNPYQRSGDFLSRVQELKKQGLSEKEIAKAVGVESTTQLRVYTQIAAHERRDLLRAQAQSLRADGKSLNEIAQIMGYNNDSSVRALLNEQTASNKSAARKTADILRDCVERKDVVDVGKGVARELGVSETKFNEALELLALEGYNVYGIGVPQVTNIGKQTNVKVLAKPDIEQRDIYADFGKIQSVSDDYFTRDDGQTYTKLEYPASVDSKRIQICYGDQGGLAKDGVIELRRGVDDLNLGKSHYAQVRILVDGTHYLKGMAMYADDLPDGVDIRFNTNKPSGTPPEKVMKGIKNDPLNPFGALIKPKGQSHYIDADGNERLSAINKLKEEGDWDVMAKNLSSQFLSKQPRDLIRKQLNLAYQNSESDYDDIMALTNPTIKKQLLLDFADTCDGATVHLKAAALPRQKTQVILPVSSMKDTEIYAPGYNNGEQVALIRYPHAGTFEIPILTVNNKNQKARSILGTDIMDAVGIHPKVAERLSGADFDGDTVTVIPVNSKVRVKSDNYLEGLVGFEPKTEYAERPGIRLMKKSEVQKEMGMISNLITDMTLRGASPEHLTRAVRHSMVVIDAEKHHLDYKRSEKENGIAELKQIYQRRPNEDGTEKVGGASTLLSRRKQEVRVPERQGGPRIDKETGEVTYRETGRTYVDKNGNRVKAEEKVSLMSTVSDARTLSSGHPVENLYADYANKMKALANRARKEAVVTKGIPYNASAKDAYSEEVKSLDSKLRIASTNAPRERRAQAIANSTVKAQLQANPELYGRDYKKERKRMAQVALEDARYSVGATGKGTRIDINDREWEAIQAGAISPTMLTEILRYTDSDKIRARAMPKERKQLSASKVASIKAMSASGYTNAEIAEKFGISTSAVYGYINS